MQMRTSLVVISLLLASCSKEGASVQAGVRSDPGKEILPIVWNFESLISGAKAEHTFTILADSSFSQGISRVQTSCGCTTAVIRHSRPGDRVPSEYKWGSPIPPGTVLDLSVLLDTTGKEGDYDGVVSLLGNQGALRTLQVVGHIQPLFDISSHAVDLGIVNSATGQSQTACPPTLVESSVVGPFYCEVDLMASSQELAIELSPKGELTGKESSGWEVRVKVRPGAAPTARFVGQIVLSASSPKFASQCPWMPESPSVVIAVEGRITEDIYVDPDYVSFGAIERGNEEARHMVVLSHGRHLSLGSPPRVAVMLNELQGLGIALEVHPTWRDQSGSYSIGFALRSSETAAPGAFRTEVEVSVPGLDNPVSVPVFGILR